MNAYEVKAKLFLKIWGGDQGLKPASKTLGRFLVITKSRKFKGDNRIMAGCVSAWHALTVTDPIDKKATFNEWTQNMGRAGLDAIKL